MANRDVTVRFLGNTTHLDQAIARLRTKLKANLGGTAGLIGVATFAAAGAALFKLGEDFDKAYNKIRVGTGATGKVLQGLEGDFKNVLKDTPASFGDTAQAISELNQKLGLTGKPLEEMSHQMLELSRVTGTDLKGNLDAATNVLNNFGVKSGEQSGKLDELFRASQATGISFSDLAGTMATGGVVLREVGFDFEHSAALVAALSKQGIDASTVFPAMAKALKASGDTGKDANKVFADTIAKIKSAKTEGEAFGVAAQIFGAKAGPKLAALIRDGKLSIDQLYQTITGGKDTIDKAGKDAETFGDKWTIIKNNVFVALEPIATGLTNVIEKMTGPLQGLASAFAGLPDPVRQAAGALLAAGTAAYLFRSQLVALVNLPLLPLVGILLAVGAAAKLAFSHIDTSDSAKQTQKFADSLGQFAKSGKLTGTAAEELGSHLGHLTSALKDFHKTEETGPALINKLYDGFKSFYGLFGGHTASDTAINNTQSALLKLYKTDPTSAITAFGRLKDGLVANGVSAKTVDSAFSKFKNTIGVVGQALAGPTAAEQQQAQAQNDLADATKQLLGAYDKLDTKAGDTAVSLVQSAHLTSDAVKQLTQDLKSVDDSAAKAFDSSGEAIKKFTQDGAVSFNDFKKYLHDQVVATGSWAANIKTLVADGLDSGFVKNLVDAGPKSATLVQSILDNVKNGSVQTINDLQTFNSQALGQFQTTLNNMVVDTETGLSQMSGAVDNYRTALFKAAAQGGKNTQANVDLLIATGNLKTQFDTFVGSVVDSAKKQADLAGTTFDATAKTGAQKDALELLKQKFPELAKPGGPIDQYQQALFAATPPARNTDVNVNTDEATYRLARLKYLADQLYFALHPNVAGPPLPAPKPPPTAIGGIFTKPEIRLIGEAGPEVVLPLKDPKRTQELLNKVGIRQGNLSAKVGGKSLASVSSGPNIYLTVNALDPRGAEDAVVKALKGWARRNGPVPVRIASGS